jgi:hypothetical protein
MATGHARKQATTESDEELREKGDEVKHEVGRETIIRHEERRSHSRSVIRVGYRHADPLEQIERREEILIHHIKKLRIAGAEKINVDRSD